MKKNTLVLIALLISMLSTRALGQDSLKTTTITVANLHCNNDMPTIKKQLHNQEGVEEVSFTEIRGGKSIFTISYHTSATTQENIEKAIESTPGCDDKNSTPYKVKNGKPAKKKMHE